MSSLHNARKGYVVAQSVEAPRYKLESFGFDSACNNDYQGYFLWGKGSLCIGLTFLCADCNSDY